MKNQTLGTIKKFVFDGLLVEDGFNLLEKDGINVHSSSQQVTVDRIDKADFSPKIVFNAQKMASIYILFFCLENPVRELIAD